MTYIKYDVSNRVATITIDRPEALNALNRVVLEELKQVLDGIQPADVRCVIVTGAGEKAFVAGADVAEMARMTQAEAREFSGLGNAVFRKLETLPMPVIAAVNGFALGGGCELALACDIRLASEKAVFGQPEVGLGITAGFGGTQRLARTVGVGAAKEMLYSTRRVDAVHAERIGLVNAVVPVADLLPTAYALADQIVRQAPAAVRATKQAINRGFQTDLDSGLALEATLFASCFETADQREAMAAFAERRQPQPFQDR